MPSENAKNIKAFNRPSKSTLARPSGSNPTASADALDLYKADESKDGYLTGAGVISETMDLQLDL